MPEVIYDPRTKTYVDENGKPVGASPQPFMSPPTGKPQDIGSNGPPMDNEAWKTMVGTGLKVGAGIASLPFGPGGFALRAGLSSALMGGAAAVEGEDPIMATAKQAGAELGGKGLGQLLPRAGAAASSLMGGRFRNIPEVVKAYMEERAAKSFGMNAIGDAKGFRDTALKVGDKLEAAESAIPNTAPLRDLAGANQQMFDKAKFAQYPRDVQDAVAGDERKFLVDHARVRAGTSVTDPNLPGGQHNNTGFVRSTRLNARELGNMKRSLNSEGERVIEARQARLPVTPEQDLNAQLASGRASRVKDVQEALPGVKETVTPLNDRLSNLHVLGNNAKGMKGGGGFIGPIVSMGGRAAFGYGLARQLGIDPTIGASVGLLGLTPNNISRMGSMGGTIADLVPAAKALGEGAYDTQEEIKRTRRRKPEGKK